MYHNKNNLFTPDVSAQGLLSIIKGYRQALFLYYALETGIFEALQEPKSVIALSAETGYPTDRLVYFLNALAAMEWAEKNGDNYILSPLAQTYLIRNSRFYLGDLIHMEYAREQISSWEMLLAWLNGESVGNDRHDPLSVFQPSFIHAMAQSVLSNGSFTETIALISTHPCFSSARNLLDLGGGHGLFSMALKQHKPELNTVVFDLPQVQEVTRAYACDYNTEIGFYPGNFYEDELPTDQDIVLAFDILHPVPPSQKEAVFAKVYHALNSGGYLFYKLWFLDDTRIHPSPTALFSLTMKITNQASHVYTLSEAKSMLSRIGFQVEKAVASNDTFSTLLIARKVG